MPRQDADDAWAAHLALKPAEEASSSRSKSAAAVPDVNAPSRTVRPPFRLFDPFSAGLCRFQPSDLHGSRSYLRRHGVQFREARVSYHKTSLAVYPKNAAKPRKTFCNHATLTSCHHVQNSRKMVRPFIWKMALYALWGQTPHGYRLSE